jgi:hypothetical protein
VPALVGPFVGFALGVLLAWLCQAEAPREDERAFRGRAQVVALFAALVFAPACAYFLIFAGDWSLSYLVDSRAVPSAVSLLLVVLDAALVVAGFTAGYRAARQRAERALLALGIVPGAAALTLVLGLLSRLRVEGTFHQVSARFGTQPVAGGPLGYAILWMDAMVIAGVVIAARALAERPRRAAPVENPEQGAPQPRAPLLGRRRP